MAIAPLPFIGGPDIEDVPWPRPTLTLVKTLERSVPVVQAPSVELPTHHGLDVGERRQIRAQRQAIRRRIVLGILAIATIVALALPLTALGTMTVSGQATPGGAPAGLADGSVYAVQAGDTLQSIAQHINPVRQSELVAQMRNEVGSSSIVTGEHLVLP